MMDSFGWGMGMMGVGWLGTILFLMLVGLAVAALIEFPRS